MSTRLVGCILGFSIVGNLCLNIATDFQDGANDFHGPYPRIPDEEVLKKQLEQAAEMKKWYVSPSQSHGYFEVINF